MDEADASHFETMTKRDLNHRASPSVFYSPNPNRTCEFQSSEITERQLCCGSAHSREFIWKIARFFDLPTDEGYFIDSPEFSVANATWCLRMYPNGRKGDCSEWMHFFLMRLHSCNSEHQINYTLGLEKCNNKKHGTSTHVTTFYANGVEVGVVNLLKRSDIIYSKKLFAPNDDLTVFCELSMIKEGGFVLSDATKLLKLSSKLQSVEISKHSQQVYPPSMLTDPEIHVWKITNFFELPMDEGFFIDSAEFSVANATWCMRLYPNGQKGDYKGWIHLLLVRLRSCNSEHRIHYRLGLKTRHNKEHGTLTHAANFHANAAEMGIVNLFKRSYVINCRKRLTLNGILTAFCHISMLAEVGVVLSNQEKESESSSKFLSKHSQLLLCPSTPSYQDTFTWKITNFFVLPMDEGYFIDSTEFSTDDVTWCLRIYPNGQKGHSSGWIHLLLVRLRPCSSQHRIHYRLGLKVQKNQEHGSLTHVVTFHANAMEMGIVNLLKRSDVINSRKLYTLNDILTAFCQILKIEEIEPSAKSQSVEMSESSQQFPLPSALSYRDTFTWEVTNFFDLPMREGFFINSAKFSIANATWCLRMYPNGQKGDNSGWIHLLLVRLRSCRSHHRIHFRLGLKLSHSNERATKTHVVTFHANAVEMGVVDLLQRSEVIENKEIFTPCGILTAFCHILMIEEVTAALSNQMEQFEPPSEILPLEILKHCNVGVLSKQSFLDAKYVIWKILPFFIQSSEVSHWKDSPIFSFINEYLFLRIHVKAKSKDKTFGEIELYLMRLNVYSPNYFITYQLKIMNSYGIWKRIKCSDKKFFSGNIIEIGVSQLHFAPDGFVTIYFQILQNEGVAETSLIAELTKLHTQFPLQYKDQLRYGTLHEHPFLAATKVMWDIPDFFGLQQKEVGYYINSPMFSLASDAWLMRLYPSGYKETSGKISFILVRLFPSALKLYVICKFSIKKSVTEFESTFNAEYTESCPVHLKQSKIMKRPLENVPKGVLTVICQMYVTEVKETAIEASSQSKRPESMSSMNHGVSGVIGLKANKSSASSLQELKSNTQKIGSKDYANVVTDEKVVHETLDEVNFTHIKTKKKINNDQLEVKHPNEEGKHQAKLDTNLFSDLVMDAVANLKLDKMNTSFHGELNSNIQKIGSKHDGNIITDEKGVDETFDDLDSTLLKKKSSEEFEVKYHVDEENDKAKLAVDKIHQDCKEMLHNEQESDVTFLVRGEEFKGHSAVLKHRSTYFASTLQHDIGKGSGLVVIDDSDPNVFSVFFQYLYSGHLENLAKENVFSLYSIAHKYGTQKLKAECVQYMINIMSLDTICDIIAFSFQQQEAELVTLATDFFCKNVTEITATLKWQMFLKENYTIANELIVKVLKK